MLSVGATVSTPVLVFKVIQVGIDDPNLAVKIPVVVPQVLPHLRVCGTAILEAAFIVA